MKKIIIIILTSFFLTNCYSQSDETKLSDKIELSYKDFLDLKLQILATQMSCGNYSISDMGKIRFPVSISLDDHNKIVFKIDGDLDTNLSNETRKEIMMEGFQFVQVGIKELLRLDFPEIKFDTFNNIIGFWYYSEAYDPCAKWEKNNFTSISY
ncbi:MAG: hypothetical protein M0Q51_17385 [Bacteroidales bacterium]|nr:hypothetical protein [Bacteroidales bacterium]